MKIQLRNVRLSFPSLYETEKYNSEDTGKFAASFLIEENDPQLEKVKSALKQVMSEQGIKKVKYSPLKDVTDSELDGHEGCWSLKATNTKRPLTLSRDKSAVSEADEVFYPGCYVNAVLDLGGFTNNYGSFLSAKLGGVQFYGDGESFAGASATVDDFDSFDDDDGDVPF